MEKHYKIELFNKNNIESTVKEAEDFINSDEVEELVNVSICQDHFEPYYYVAVTYKAKIENETKNL